MWKQEEQGVRIPTSAIRKLLTPDLQRGWMEKEAENDCYNWQMITKQ